MVDYTLTVSTVYSGASMSKRYRNRLGCSQNQDPRSRPSPARPGGVRTEVQRKGHSLRYAWPVTRLEVRSLLQ